MRTRCGPRVPADPPGPTTCVWCRVVKPWQQGAVGGIGAGLLVGLALGAVFVSDADHIGNLAEWVGAVGTIAAVLYAGRALRHELEGQRAEARELAWRQARQVVIQVFMVDVPGPFNPATGTYAPATAVTVRALVINGSTEPITSVEIRYEAGGHEAVTFELPVVAPATNIHTPAHSWEGVDVDAPHLLAEMWFVDARGARWHRDSNARLEEAPLW